jgi:hypothetical protein
LEVSSNKFIESEILKIENLFSNKFIKSENSFSIKIKNEKINSIISLEIISEDDKALISVYTNNAHLQLQSCSYFIISEMLEEVIFISEEAETISGLIISKRGDCSLYSNVEKKLLRSDFMELNSEKLLAAVALSVTESIDESGAE